MRPKGRWPEDLLSVLWAYRTTPRTTTGENPFKLAYGTVAIIPAEIGVPSQRVKQFDAVMNDKGLRLNLDLLDEAKDEVVLRLTQYQRRVARHYDKNVKKRTFHVGDPS